MKTKVSRAYLPALAKFILRLSHRHGIAVIAHFPTAGFKFVVPSLSSVPVWYPSSFPRSGGRSVATDLICRTIPRAALCEAQHISPSALRLRRI